MRRVLLGAVVTCLIAAPGVAAQGHAHGAQPQAADSAQGMQGMMQHQDMMQQMMERMQGMQQMMQSMMEEMRAGQSGHQSMQGMQAQTCIMSGPQAAVSALLMGSVTDLALTEAQRTELTAILGRAQDDALAALTDEQRARLEASPAQAGATCQQEGMPDHGGHGG